MFESPVYVLGLAVVIAGSLLFPLMAMSVREGLLQRFRIDCEEDPSHRSFFLFRPAYQWAAIKRQLSQLPAAYAEGIARCNRYYWISLALVVLLFSLLGSQWYYETNRYASIASDCSAAEANE